jgi:hypothetical protein
MLIEENKLKHWMEHFYGYGSWDAKIWFVGYEEGGGEVPEEVSEKFNYFQAEHPRVSHATLCDLRELYRCVTFRGDGPRANQFKNFHEYRFSKEAILHGVWRNLIAFVHGYDKEPLPDLLAYQQEDFVSTKSREALIQLYPLPSSHNHAWYYSWLDVPPHYGFLKSRALYEDHLFSTRMQRILHCIKLYRPQVVAMYGMNNINELKASVQHFFPDAKFKAIKGTKLVTPQHHRADFDGTTMLITTQVPALKHNRIETGYDWHAFGKLAKAG